MLRPSGLTRTYPSQPAPAPPGGEGYASTHIPHNGGAPRPVGGGCGGGVWLDEFA